LHEKHALHTANFQQAQDWTKFYLLPASKQQLTCMTYT